MQATDWWAQQLAGRIAGRRWIVAVDAAVSGARQAEELLARGAEDVMVVATTRGTGPLDAGYLDGTRPCVILDVHADTMMEGIRASERALSDLPPAAREAVDRFDPDGGARVIRALFSSDEPVAGRAVYGGRPAAWRALEDKLIIDAVWDAVGVPRSPSENLSLSDLGRLEQACRRLDQGLGTMWAGDNRSGWHGGATSLRWVRAPHEAPEVAAELAASCDRVRVMPFLEGVPCSIHGIVLPDHVASLRPCEMLVFRRPGSRVLLYAAAATFWDPAPADRQAMRDVVRRTGAWLRAELGYRGVFTVDGVMGADGFRPTELNPRFGAAIGVMARALPDLPLYLMHLALVEGEPLAWRSTALEEMLVGAADGLRSGRIGFTVSGTRETVEAALVVDGRGVRLADANEEPTATVHIGPSASGSYVGVGLSSEHTPTGPPVGPRAAAIINFLDTTFGLDVGPVTAARAVR